MTLSSNEGTGRYTLVDSEAARRNAERTVAGADKEHKVLQDHEERLRTIETTTNELSTIKKLLAGLLAIGLPVAGAFIYQTIVVETRQSVLQETVDKHSAGLLHVTQDVQEIRTDLRVLITEVRAAEQRRADRDHDLMQRLQRLEGAQQPSSLTSRRSP